MYIFISQACDIKQWDSEDSCPRGELLYSVAAVDAILCMPCDVIDVDAMDAAGKEYMNTHTHMHMTTGTHILTFDYTYTYSNVNTHTQHSHTHTRTHLNNLV